MKKKIFIMLLLIIIIIPLFSDEEEKRGIQVVTKELGSDVVLGKQYLVVIAIDKYEHWLPLHNPVKDAKSFRDVLKEKYYIDVVIELYDKDATKANIIRLFSNLAEKIEINDSLLIFYAGHGHLDKNTNTGFWIPVNAGTDMFEQENWLPNTQIKGVISNIEASHICLIVDSCFSGDILDTSRAAMIPTIDNDYFKKAYARTSRQVLTSGANETVPDKSEFARELLRALKKNNKRYLDPLMIYNEIRLGIKKTQPMFGSLNDTGHQEGASFLIFLKKSTDGVEDTEITETETLDITEPEVIYNNKKNDLNFSIAFQPYVSMPVLNKEDYVTPGFGFGFDLNGIIAINRNFSGFINTNYQWTDLNEVETSISLLAGGGGVYYTLPVTKYSSFTAAACLGYFIGFINYEDSTARNNPYFTTGITYNYQIMRMELGAQCQYRNYYSLYSAFCVSADLKLKF